MFEVCNSVRLVHGETDVNPGCMLKFIEISCMFHTKIINMKKNCLIFVTMIVVEPEPTILIIQLSSL